MLYGEVKTMDMLQLVGNLGFPIAACVGMGWYAKYITDNHRADLNNLNGRHRDMELKMLEAINNNTNVMIRLCERLGEKELAQEGEKYECSD